MVVGAGWTVVEGEGGGAVGGWSGDGLWMGTALNVQV